MEIKVLKNDGTVLLKRKIERNKKEVIDIEKKIIKICKDRLRVNFKIPVIDIHGYWTTDMFLPKMTLDWVINLYSAFQKNFPYISFFNQDNKNRFTFGSTNLIDDSVLIAKINQQEGTYDMEFLVTINEETEDFKLFFDLKDKNWTEIINDYRKIIYPSLNFSYPDTAYSPVYCSWYAFHADFNQKELEEQIEIAEKLGFGTFIVDDGWCFDQCKRVNPETIKNWYENIGDWKVSKKKFPDFITHLNYAHKLGFKYILWIAPFIVGKKSKIYKEIKLFLSEEFEGYRIIDPEDKFAIDKILNNILHVFVFYKLDGLKIDFIDTIEPSLEKPRGRIIYSLVKNFINEIRKINPSALIEFREKYATPIMLNYATQFRAGDVPFDFLGNLYRIAHIRLCLGDKIPVHSDPAYWDFKEDNVNVARHMIVSLTGVPMLSMDLKKMFYEHKEIVKNYIQFYKNHIDVFKYGNWKIEYEFGNIAYIVVENEHKKICFVIEEKYIDELLTKDKKEIYILNLGNKVIKIKNCITYDFFGNHFEKDLIPIGGRGEV